MALNAKLVKTIKANLADKTSDELRQMLAAHDTSQFSDEAFEAARELLADRAEGRAAEPVPASKAAVARKPEMTRRWQAVIMLGPVVLAIIGVAIWYNIAQSRKTAEVQDFARMTKAGEYKEAFALVDTKFTMNLGRTEWEQLEIYLKAPAPLDTSEVKGMPVGMKLTILAFLASHPSRFETADLDGAAFFAALCKTVYSRYGLFERDFAVERVDSEAKMSNLTVVPVAMKGHSTRWFLVKLPDGKHKIAFASITYEFDALVKKLMQESGKGEDEFLRGELAKLSKAEKP